MTDTGKKAIERAAHMEDELIALRAELAKYKAHVPDGVCWECGPANCLGMSKGHQPTCWYGMCIFCHEIKSVCAKSDWGGVK